MAKTDLMHDLYTDMLGSLAGYTLKSINEGDIIILLHRFGYSSGEILEHIDNIMAYRARAL